MHLWIWYQVCLLCILNEGFKRVLLFLLVPIQRETIPGQLLPFHLFKHGNEHSLSNFLSWSHTPEPLPLYMYILPWKKNPLGFLGTNYNQSCLFLWRRNLWWFKLHLRATRAFMFKLYDFLIFSCICVPLIATRCFIENQPQYDFRCCFCFDIPACMQSELRDSYFLLSSFSSIFSNQKLRCTLSFHLPIDFPSHMDICMLFGRVMCKHNFCSV